METRSSTDDSVTFIVRTAIKTLGKPLNFGIRMEARQTLPPQRPRTKGSILPAVEPAIRWAEQRSLFNWIVIGIPERPPSPAGL